MQECTQARNQVQKMFRLLADHEERKVPSDLHKIGLAYVEVWVVLQHKTSGQRISRYAVSLVEENKKFNQRKNSYRRKYIKQRDTPGR